MQLREGVPIQIGLRSRHSNLSLFFIRCFDSLYTNLPERQLSYYEPIMLNAIANIQP